MNKSFAIDNRYIITNQIKIGGFAIIHKGYDLQLDKNPVAIKEISPNLLGNKRFINMFLDEALTTAKLRHANIVTVYELRKTDDNRFFIIMEYIEGVDLRTLIQKCKQKGRSVPIEIAIHIIGEVCKALDYAHNKKDPILGTPLEIIHRDISPSNIMASIDGMVKVIDFGIANARFRKSQETEAGIIKGKTAYMSPEQIKVDKIDHRSDLFSLGIVMYEVLTAEKLFWDKSNYNLLKLITNVKIEPAKFKKYKIPLELQKIVLKATKKKPKDRYKTARDMYYDIDNYIQKTRTGDLSFQLGDFVRYLHFDRQIPKIEISKKAIKVDDSTIIVRTQALQPKIDDTGQELGVKGIKPVLKVTKKQKKTKQSNNDTQPIEDFIRKTFSSKQSRAEKVNMGIIAQLYSRIRNFKRGLKIGAVSLVFIVITFFILDFFFKWTLIGKQINSMFLPPLLVIETIPSNATIELDGKELDGRTPITVKQIQSGRHRLRLIHDDYEPLNRTIDIPRSGTIKEVFPFQITFHLESNPDGAIVYLNGTEYKERTSCQIKWDINRELEIKMQLQGFDDTITGFTFKGINESPYIQDTGVWDFQRIEAPTSVLQVTGSFYRLVSINSHPAGAEIYIDDELNPAGNTNNNKIRLTFGEHQLLLRKAGFIDLEFPLNIRKNSYSTLIDTFLSRTVLVEAIDALFETNREIRASIVSITNQDGIPIQRSRTMTPAVLILEYKTHIIKLRKPGYRDATEVINPDQSRISVNMQRQP